MERGAGRRVDVRPRGALTFAEVRALPRLGRVGTSTLRSWLAGKALGLLPPHDGRRGVALYPLAVVQALPGEARPRTRAPSKPRRRARKGRAPSYGLPPGWEAATSLVARLGLDSVRRLRELARRWNEAIRSSPWPALPVVDRDDPVALAVTQLNATRRVVDGRLRWVFRALAIEFAVQHAWRPPTDLPWLDARTLARVAREALGRGRAPRVQRRGHRRGGPLPAPAAGSDRRGAVVLRARLRAPRPEDPRRGSTALTPSAGSGCSRLSTR